MQSSAFNPLFWAPLRGSATQWSFGANIAPFTVLARCRDRHVEPIPTSTELAAPMQPSSKGAASNIRTCNQCVMSGKLSIGFIDFATLSFEFDRVPRGLFTSFLVRNWCGQ